MKLWDKNGGAAAMVHAFTVGNDRELDKRLAPFDIQASKAHAQMLAQVGLMNNKENETVQSVLDELLPTVLTADFTIPEAFEDIHSWLEFQLTEMIGEAGKKIHTARSRNDQVLVALQLYCKDLLEKTRSKTAHLAEILCDKATEYEHAYIPGYTHTQVAMPSSVGMWLSAYAELLADDLEALKAAYHIADQNPLGTAAGYGTAFPIDREVTTGLLGFSQMRINPVAAQLSRGKLEAQVVFALSQVGTTLGRLANDCVWYLCQNFGFISFPDSVTTGSSIMPHKKNPDVFELVRAKSGQLNVLVTEAQSLSRNLLSGYHRDFQLLKEPLFRAADLCEELLEIMLFMLPQLQAESVDLSKETYAGIFSVDEVTKRVIGGLSFREAYHELKNVTNYALPQKPLETMHTGSLSNLGLKEIREKIRNYGADCNPPEQQFARTI